MTTLTSPRVSHPCEFQATFMYQRDKSGVIHAANCLNPSRAGTVLLMPNLGGQPTPDTGLLAPAWLPANTTVPAELGGRFSILDVSPSILGGRRSAAGAAGEAIPVQVTAFREGHDALGVEVVLHSPNGSEYSRVRMQPRNDGLDTWAAHIRPDAMGLWTFDIEAWGDP
ncbi:MAG: DUF3416 domain-containing protein, partial [Actinobacteria bacterium]|nr:DUF3416 domain-containing protein [Actinomycetota bacterium]